MYLLELEWPNAASLGTGPSSDSSEGRNPPCNEEPCGGFGHAKQPERERASRRESVVPAEIASRTAFGFALASQQLGLLAIELFL